MAAQACAAGADVINDTWAGHDPAAAGGGRRVRRRAGVFAHRRRSAANPAVPGELRRTVTGVVDDVIAEVDRRRRTRGGGRRVRRDGILIDPTHDFGKNTFHGLALLRHVKDLVDTGWPVLMALSNKDFIGETLGVELTERLEGTLAATALAAADGARMFRVHEVGPTRRVLEMVASIRGDRPPARTVRGLA